MAENYIYQEAYNQQGHYQSPTPLGMGINPQAQMVMKQSSFQGGYQQQGAQMAQQYNQYPQQGGQMVQMNVGGAQPQQQQQQQQQQLMQQVQTQQVIQQQPQQIPQQGAQMQAYHQPQQQIPSGALQQQAYQVTAQPSQSHPQQAQQSSQAQSNSQYTTYRVPTYGGVQDSLVFDAINCIIEPTEELGGIYLGNLESACDLNILKKMKIRAVLTVAVETGQTYPEEVVHFHEVIPAEDMPYFDLTPYYEQSFEFIDRHRRYTSILVHCFAGVSRSASIVIAYIMAKYNCTFEESFNYVREKRKQVYPNPGFIDQLKKFEAGLKFNPGLGIQVAPQQQVAAGPPQHMVQSSTFMTTPQTMQPGPQKYIPGYPPQQQAGAQIQVPQQPQQQAQQQGMMGGYPQQQGAPQQQPQQAYQVVQKPQAQGAQQFNYQQMPVQQPQQQQQQQQQQPQALMQAQAQPAGAYNQQYKVSAATNSPAGNYQQISQIGGQQGMIAQPGLGLNNAGYMGTPIGVGGQYSNKYK